MTARRSSLSLLPVPVPVQDARPRIVAPGPPVPPDVGLSSPRPARELWLAVHLPQFMLDALGGAAAVVDLQRDGKVVCACDAAAAAAGVTPGMAVNSALALLPELRTVPREPRREQALLETVGARALRYSPRVSLEPPDAVLLEVRGSLRLFGGARALCERLRAELQASGIVARLALTPTPVASLWFARAGREIAFRRADELASRLAALPLAVTRWPEKSQQLLVTMGARTVGDCLRLPRDGFARRFEPEMLRALDRAAGRVPDPRVAFRAGEKFVTRCDFEPEMSDTARLEVAIRPLLDELGTFLRQRGRGVTAIELRLCHRGAPATRVRLRFVAPTGDGTHIAWLLHERLDRVTLPEPVRAARLASGPLVELQEAGVELFVTDRRASGAAVPQLVERLRARLGTEAVEGIGLVPEHRPEFAWQKGTLSFFGKKEGRKGDILLFQTSEKGECPLFSRPLWLLTEPQSLGQGDPPRFEGALTLEEGPERIESGWWDGHDVRRDYYVARNRAGVRLWVFRERRSRDGDGDGGWFLHGVFG